ncbi:DA1-related protein 2 [Striga asiatica]|uniref:DA1-related protein 2 n=1 Tax=Striga asiatica TaxID=4170 RepID=A0A5A7PQ61_STRAF|nr:DA1-related protein 2 [Striga asiatica]
MSSSNVNHLSQPCIYGHVVSSHADRKSRFMKWLSRLFKGGASNRHADTGGQQPQSFGDENTVWRAPVRSLDDRSRANKEKEELDRAIALSLAEDLKKPNGYKWRTDNDEHNNGFNSAPYPSYAPSDYYHMSYRICGGCKREIVYGNYLGCMGTFYHPDCFRCSACHYPITEHEIPTNGVGLIEYRCHPFWSQKYCPSHEHDATARCCSCERLESWNTKYISLGDGRNICLECMESAIMDTGDCQPLYHSIRDFYEGMNMRIDQQIPMLLVERHALNEAIEGEKHGFHHMPETRGLCLSEEQTVTSVLKRPRMERAGLVGIRTQPQKLIRKCEVTAILVLYGLPRLLTGSILAHELMHGWLRLNGYRNLAPEVEEGICQVLSHMWLESEVIPETRNMPSTSSSSSLTTTKKWPYGSSTMTSSSSSSSVWSSSKKGGRSSVENKLGEFFMHQIAHDASPAYGGGYRAAMSAVNKFGLRRTLDHIQYTGQFPM